MSLQQLLQFARSGHDNGVAFDAQKLLVDYAAFHHADSKIWTFATGDEKEIDLLTRAFSVYRQTEGDTISHGLATALINRDGTVEKMWRGNAWTPAEVTEAIKAKNDPSTRELGSHAQQTLADGRIILRAI